jgi:hypothetical protein
MNKDDQVINRAKTHTTIDVHRGARTSKGKLWSQSLVDKNLVVAHGAIEEPIEAYISKLIHACIVT